MRRILPLLLAAVLAGLAGCDGTASVISPPPATSTTLGESASEEPSSRVEPLELASVNGNTTTTVAIGPGSASINGRVLGPGGPVDGATVRVERIVGSSSAFLNVTADASGNYSVPKIRGGRYRVRAWRSPDLAQTKPDIFFLEGTEAKQLDLRPSAYNQLSVVSSISPNPPISGQSATVTVQTVVKTVDANGVVRSVGSAATLELFATTSGAMRLESASAQATDGTGRASWRVRCVTTGSGGLTVRMNGTNSYAVNVSACTSPAASPTSTTTGATTTTTA